MSNIPSNQITRWKCVGYCRHCTADEDDSTFSKEWGHFEKSDNGVWVRADSALAEIERLTSVAEAEMKLREGNFAEIARLRAALREAIGLAEDWGDVQACNTYMLGVLAPLKALAGESGCEPGPIVPEPQDYKVQCRCGWLGHVSALKSLPDFKMGCPDCSAEFVPINKLTFPIESLPEHCPKCGEPHGGKCPYQP